MAWVRCKSSLFHAHFHQLNIRLLVSTLKTNPSKQSKADSRYLMGRLVLIKRNLRSMVSGSLVDRNTRNINDLGNTFLFGREGIVSGIGKAILDNG